MNVNVQQPIDLGSVERFSDTNSDLLSKLPTSEHSPSSQNNNQPNIEKDFNNVDYASETKNTLNCETLEFKDDEQNSRFEKMSRPINKKSKGLLIEQQKNQPQKSQDLMDEIMLDNSSSDGSTSNDHNTDEKTAEKEQIYDDEKLCAEFVGMNWYMQKKEHSIFVNDDDLGLNCKPISYGNSNICIPKPKSKVVTIYYSNKKILFKGETKNGKANGFGTVYDPKGTLYYQGTLKDNLMHGFGTVYYEKESKFFEGDFEDDQKQGCGTLYYRNGKVYYFGEMQKGQKEGRGKTFYDSGCIQYQGQFKNNMANGIGKHYDEKGIIQYSGEFENGVGCGLAKSYNDSGVLIFVGHFKNGLANGEGQIFNKVSREDKFTAEDLKTKTNLIMIEGHINFVNYVGYFRDGFKHGAGIIYNEDGVKIFEG